jgi:large subunit ribosomal protein L10
MTKKEKLGKLCKEKMVEEVLSSFKEHPNFFITSYMGTSVSELEQVRKNLRASSSEYLVVKNSILRVILDKLKLESMKDMVDGGVGVSFSGEDFISACKVLVRFSKDHDKFKIKGALLDGKVVTLDKVKEIASLPAKDALRAQAIAGIKAPITGFVFTLSGILRKFVYAVDAVKSRRPAQA